MYHACMKDVVDILSKYKLEANSENCMVECKEASNLIPKSMWETYSAFANTSGGCIFLGVRVYRNSPAFDLNTKYRAVSCCFALYLVVSCALIALQLVACRLKLL